MPTEGRNSDSNNALRKEPTVPCRVLLVDDDEVVARHLSALLQQAGYEVHLARSGEEALRLLDSTYCQIVLTDWQMPDMDGCIRECALRRFIGPTRPRCADELARVLDWKRTLDPMMYQ